MSRGHNIRFARSSDGARIAFWDIGSGPALIIGHNMTLSHVGLDWDVPSLASFYTALAERCRVIRFDPRNCGMSDRTPGAPMTADTVGSDLTAVADACGIDEFTLIGVSPMGPPMIEYAASHPDRVKHLILCDADTYVSESRHASYIKGLAALAGIDDGQLVSHLYLNVVPREEAAAMRELLAANSSDVPLLAEAVQKWDARPKLESVTVPSLVIQSRESILTNIEDGRRLAAALPNSRLVVVDGQFAPYLADQEAILQAIADFLGYEGRMQQQSDPHDTSGVKTVVFTDLVSSTQVMSRLGDEQGRTAIREIENTVRELAIEHSGKVVKNLGDGSLISFDSPQNALRFAMRIQQQMEPGPYDMRIGMAAGEPIEEDDDLHGAVVVQASRIADLGLSGEIMVADSVRHLAMGKGYTFAPAGDVTLKGFDQPTAIWRVTGATGPGT